MFRPYHTLKRLPTKQSNPSNAMYIPSIASRAEVTLGLLSAILKCGEQFIRAAELPFNNLGRK